MKNPGTERENPRTTRVRKVILDAATELLINSGAGEVTATRISETTGVARTTIYRQWPDQASLLLATIEALVAADYETTDTGNVEEDLRNSLLALRVRLVSRAVRPLFAAVVDLASRDDAFVTSQQAFITALVDQPRQILAAAERRGALPKDLNCDLAATALTGPLLYQFLVMREDIDDELIELVLTQFFQTLPAG